MAFLYPWGNTQQLNLDWILQKIKELEAGSGTDLDEVANALIAASYRAQAYDRSDIVFHDGKLYRANQAIPAPGEAWTPAHWDEILLGDTVSNLVQYVAALSNDQIVNSSGVSGDHTSDALDTLKNAIDGIEDNYLELDSGNIAEIPNGTDYDTLRTPGNYYCGNQANAATMINSPYSITGYYSAHRLEVIALTPSRYAQIVVNNTTRPVVCYRYYNGTTWGSWYHLDPAHNIQQFQAVPINPANNAEIARITAPDITADSIVLSCTFANPTNITSNISWQSYNGYIAFTGTCTASTTAEIIITM